MYSVSNWGLSRGEGRGGGVKFSGVLVLGRKILARTLRVLCEEE